MAVAQRAYNALYHQAALKFPDDDALVESFFLSGTDGAAEAAPAEAAPAADAAPPAAEAPAKVKSAKRKRR